MKIEADRPLTDEEREAIHLHFQDKTMEAGSKYMVNFGSSSVTIIFQEEAKPKAQSPTANTGDQFNLGVGYECPEFLKNRIPGPQRKFLDDGSNLEVRIKRGLHRFKQVGLVGPTGVGKTHVVYTIAAESKLPLFEVNCALQTSTYELVGKYIGLGRENWIDGVIIMWCKYGGILYLDEANMMKPDILSKCHPIMDHRGHIILTEKENEIVHRHPYGYIVLSFNPFSIEYAGTKPLNVAFRRRVSAWFHFGYLSKGPKISDFEVKAVMERAGLDDERTAYNIVKTAAELRKLYESGELPMAPSLGNLSNWATLIALDGVPVIKAANETIIDTISDDPSVKAIVRRVINSVFVAGEGTRPA